MKHRGTEEHRGVEGTRRNGAWVCPKPAGFTPVSAGPRQINRPRKARCRPPDSHRTRSVLLRTALTGRSCRGRPDLAFHARLMELALQAANAAGLLPATIGFLRHHRLLTARRLLPMRLKVPCTVRLRSQPRSSPAI